MSKFAVKTEVADVEFFENKTDAEVYILELIEEGVTLGAISVYKLKEIDVDVRIIG